MIDISQLVGNAAASLNNTKSSDATKGSDANLFQDTLTRARQDSQQAAASATPVKVPAKDGKQTNTAKNDTAQKPQADKSAQAGQNNALPKQDDGKVVKSDSTADATVAKDATSAEDDAKTSADAAAVAAALAAAALLAPLPTPQPAQANGAPVDGAAIAGLPTLPGQAPAAAAAALATASPTTNAAADAAADAAALQAQVDANVVTTTVTEAPKGSVPNAGDTLALIAQQRAALQNTTPTAADKLAAVATAPAQTSAQNTGGQGAGQQQANLGQSNQQALPQTDTQATQSTTTTNPFAAAQASARTGEAADTGATNASSAATMASALAAQTATQHTQAATAAATRAAIAPNLNDSQWSQALGQQMVRLSTQGNQTAELDLNPPNLGPLKVVLNVVNDQAQAQFVSPHQAVRAAVEAALPQLRTSMAEAGIQLGQASVGADSFAQAGNSGQQQQQPQRQSGNGFSQAMGFGNEPAAPAAPSTPRAPRVLARGEVDTFA